MTRETQTSLVAEQTVTVKASRMTRGRLIRMRMLGLGVNLKRLAETVGLSSSHISNHLSGRHKHPSVQRRIAEALACGPEELWGEWLHPSLRRSA